MRTLALALALALASCAVTNVDAPDPAAVPTGPIEAQGAEAEGPIVELGSGTGQGAGWRYAIYPSEEGWCTQLELALVTSTGCGDLLPAEGATFGGVGRGETQSGLTAIEGIVSDEVATVWLVTGGGSGARFPATMFVLDEAGLEAQAFLGLVAEDVDVTHVMAVAWNGRVLETYELP